MRQHGVVNSAADDTECGRGVQCIGVFISIERDQGKAFANVADEQHGLVPADAVLARHPGQCRIHFSETVRSAAAGGFVELDEQLQACLVMDVISVEYRHQHGRIEEPLHSPLPRFAKSRSSRICCNISPVTDAGRGCPARNTQTPCSLVRAPVPRTGRSVICSADLLISRESPGSKCNSSLSGLGITTRPALSMTRRAFILAQYCGLTQQSKPL